MVKWESKKLVHFLYFLIGLTAVVIVNQLAERMRFRWDLTEEKRFSISDATKELLKELEETVYVDVYLEGEMPSNFKRFRNAIAETLEEFKVYSDNRVQFQFRDPSIAQSDQSKNEFYTYLAKSGIQPTNLSYSTDGKKTEKLIFPGALVSYFGTEKGVLLLKGNKGTSKEDVINQSIEGVEYHLASAIRELSLDLRKKIGIVQGHGELDTALTAGLTNTLLEKYDVFNVNLPVRTKSLSEYDLLILAKPTGKFTALEKYRMDQYMMNGGKLMAFIDALKVNLDSIGEQGSYAFPYETNLTDFFFRYGVRVNADYIQDINCGQMPFVAGTIGDQPQFRLMPWPFFPVINNYGDHPVVKGIDASLVKFVSTLDTVKAVGIKKTPLMHTSPYSRVLGSPVKVSVNDLRNEATPDKFQAGPQAIAYLLEGKFQSLFKNRILPAGAEKATFIAEGTSTRIIVVSDGDFIRNEFDPKSGNPVPLGVDPYSGTHYANADFVLNAIDFLIDQNGLIMAKTKEVKIRPLDKVKVKDQKTMWQVVNMALPLVLLVLFGILKYLLRKRKYARFEVRE